MQEKELLVIQGLGNLRLRQTLPIPVRGVTKGTGRAGMTRFFHLLIE